MSGCDIIVGMKRVAGKMLAREIFTAALQAVDPYEAVLSRRQALDAEFRRGRFKRMVVAGFGKAACPMAKALEKCLPEWISRGIVITKYGHGEGYDLRKTRIIEAGHPIPDHNGLRGTEEAIRLLEEADAETVVVCLISGGGSALLVSPADGLTLDDKMTVTGQLLRAGADIYDLNTVRKHLSRVKGGRLAGIAYPASIVSLVLSDVVGDRLDVIASGPTAPDSSTYHDALGVLKKYDLLHVAPPAVVALLRSGSGGMFPDTPKEGSHVFERVRNIIVGSNRMALDAARARAGSYGLTADIIASDLTGEAREAGRWLALKAGEARASSGLRRPCCLISGGETTVTVKGNGLGGRNMELALSFAVEIDGIEGISLLSAGTDGTDGPTDAAGAFVDGRTLSRARAMGLDPARYLEENDSYHFFRKMDELFLTGPTGTNVMDIQIMVIE
jgi:hydroxypyruvate reductase/glycerate 2-kinase